MNAIGLPRFPAVIVGTALWVGFAASASADASSLTDFETDTGLAVSEVVQLRGGEFEESRYRTRSYQFIAPVAELQRRMSELGMRPMDLNNDFDRAISRLLGLANPFGTPFGTRSGRLGLHNAWGAFWLLPPYRQTWIACYPKGGSYGFRVAEVEGGTGSQRTVTFAAHEAGDADHAESECARERSHASFYMVYLEMFDPSPRPLLPYPFAEREFRKVISPTLEARDLHFHGTFFVDSSYYFRFQLGREAFSRLVAEHQLQSQPRSAPDEAIDKDPEQFPDWWLSEAEAVAASWYAGCWQFGQFPVLPLATWHEGRVYWYASGVAGAQRAYCDKHQSTGAGS